MSHKSQKQLAIIARLDAIGDALRKDNANVLAFEAAKKVESFELERLFSFGVCDDYRLHNASAKAFEAAKLIAASPLGEIETLAYYLRLS